jgi:hypothetical protein
MDMGSFPGMTQNEMFFVHYLWSVKGLINIIAGTDGEV